MTDDTYGPLTPAWAALAEKAAEFKTTTLRKLFDADSYRPENLQREAVGIFLDFSRQRTTRRTAIDIFTQPPFNGRVVPVLNIRCRASSSNNRRPARPPGTATMGQMLTIGVGFTVLCTLVVLPAIMPVALGHSGNGRPGEGN